MLPLRPGARPAKSPSLPSLESCWCWPMPCSATAPLTKHGQPPFVQKPLDTLHSYLLRCAACAARTETLLVRLGETTMKTARPRIHLRLEQLEDRIVPSSPIDLTFATTSDARTISVNYTITGDSLGGQNVTFNIYRSATFNSPGGAQLIGTATIPGSDSTDLSAGTHTGVKLSLTAANGQPVTALTPNTALPFIVVVDNLDNSSASFQTHVLGVIAHGLEFDPFLVFSDQVPQWETQMAADLKSDGYDDAIAFNWVRLSVLPFPFALTLASNLLYQQVVAEANQLAGQHPGD